MFCEDGNRHDKRFELITFPTQLSLIIHFISNPFSGPIKLVFDLCLGIKEDYQIFLVT
jgi:hypothetical protein